MSVVILCTPGDHQACAVIAALRQRGVEPLLWYPSDFPTKSTESFAFSGNIRELTLNGRSQPDSWRDASVWLRRIGSNSDFTGLHPADHAFSWAQRQAFRQGSLLAAFPDAFWVNPPATARLADNKLYQHAYALGLGFTLPDSLYTNDPDAIRSFLQSHGGQAVYKAFPAPGWSDGTTEFAVHTVHITEEALVADSLILATPGIYQEVVPKTCEVRLTIMGAHAFAVTIHSQQTTHGKIDWRRAYDEIEMLPTTLPHTLVQSCMALMRRLDLVFGCFDFIVTPDGEYVFLEVNQQGQFSFIEQYTGLPLLDAFTEFLIQGRVDFSWSAQNVQIRLDDVAEAARAMADEDKRLHVLAPYPMVQE